MTVSVSAWKAPEGTHVFVEGDRQCGKTETMVNLVAGGILAHGSPVVVAHDQAEAERVGERLTARLAELGVPNPQQAVKRSVRTYKHDQSHKRGLNGPFYHETREV